MSALNGHEIPSVVQEMGDSYGAAITLYLAHAADEIPPWGTWPQDRDRKLREFYKMEHMLAGAIFGTCSRYAAFNWVLHGPKRQCDIVHRILHNSEHGRGWLQLMIPVIKDMLTQDVGAFIEVVRLDDSPTSPVIQLNHLDSGRCIPTGDWTKPVRYWDLKGGLHELKWYQVARLTEYPSPDERMRGYQECAVSRLLIAAQKARDITLYEREKIGGRNPASLHLVGGINKRTVEDMIATMQNIADNQGYMHYMLPPVITAIDPTARVSHEQIDLKGLPDGYDSAEEHRQYIVALALAIGIDPQDIAPLPGGNLGSAQQSQVLQQKGRGKGPNLFMTNMEHIMNMHGIMPKTVSFRYEEQDIAEEDQQTMLKWRRSQMYRLMAGNGQEQPILSPEIIRQMMRDAGDLKQEYLDAINERDMTPTVDVESGDKTKSWLDRWIKR